MLAVKVAIAAGVCGLLLASLAASAARPDHSSRTVSVTLSGKTIARICSENTSAARGAATRGLATDQGAPGLAGAAGGGR